MNTAIWECLDESAGPEGPVLRTPTTNPRVDYMRKKRPADATATRILSPEEYPESITAPAFPGAHKASVIFAVQHPHGLYHVEDEGAGTLGVYFTPRRAKKPRRVATAANMPGAFRRISHHEDELIHPGAEREEGKRGPVSIYALGQRTKEAKPKSQLDQELDTWLAAHGYGA